MAVSTTDSFSGPYQANGVTVAFPFTFKAVSSDDVLVFARGGGSDTPITPSAYTVSLAETGGTVVFSQAPAPSNGEIYIVSEPSLLQAVNFATGQPFLPDVVNEVNDRAAIRDLALKREIDRGLKLPLGESGVDLPTAAERAERALAFGPDGKPTVYIPFGNEDKADRLDVVPVNFMKFVPRTKWSGIIDGTLIGNLNDEWDAFRASGEKAVLMPEGLCPFDLDGWSMMAEQQGMTLLGYGRTRSKIKNIKATGIAARPLLISTGDGFTMRGVDMLHNALELTQPTMANNSIPMGSTVMLMGNNFLVEDCGGQDSWDNIYSAGKIDLETGVFEPGSPGDGVFNRVRTFNGGRAIQTLLGSGVPAPQPFQSGAGINILTGGRCAVNHCRDFFSTTGFALDYGSGAQSVFNSCMGYGNQRSIGDYPSLGATPGGQAFYVGGRGIYIGCESFDGQGDSFWFDATSFDCIAVACRSRGSQKHGAVVQGYNQQIEILVEDASQAGTGQFDAIVMRGGKWEGGNLYSDSYDVVVNGQTRGDKHRYGIGIEQGTYKITGEARGNYQGNTGAINNPDSTRVLVDARISGDEATKVIIGREVARSANNSFLDEAFGDFQGNGTLFVEDFAVPARRMVMGIDPVNVVAILQSIWAGYSPLDLAINPSGGKVILGRGDWQFPTVINGMRLWSTAGIMYTKMSDPTGATDGAAILGGGGSVASVSGASTIPGVGLNGTVTSTGPLTLELSDSNAARTAFGVAYLEDVKAALYPLDADHNAALAWYLANIATTVRLRGTGPYILGDANLPNGAVIEGSRAVAAIFKRAAGAKSIFKIAAANVVMRNMRLDGEAWDANGLADPARVGVSTILSSTSTTITVAAGHGARFAVGMDAFFPTDLFVGFDAHGRITDVTGDVLTFHAPIEGAPIVGGKVLADHPLIDIAEDAYAPSCQNLYLRNFVAGIRTGATVSAGNAIPGIQGCLLENYTGAGIIQREGMAGESIADVRLSPNHTVRKTTVAAGGETSIPYEWNVTPYMHRGSDGPSITVTKNGVPLVYSTDYTVNPANGMIGLVTPASPGDVFIASNNEWSRGFLFDGRSGSVNGMGTLSNPIVIGATIALDVRGGASGGVEYLNVTGGVFDTCSLACVRTNDTRGVRLTGTSMLFAPYPIYIGALNRGFNAASFETTVMTSAAIRDPADRPNRAALTPVSGHTGTRIDRASWFGSNSIAGDAASIQWISDVVLLEDGTSAAPGLAYRGAPTTGFFRNASGDIVFQRSGLDKGKITDKGLRVPFGSLGEPGIGFAGSGVANADDGFYYASTAIRAGVQGGFKFFFGQSDCGTINVPFRLTPYTVATLPTPGTGARTAYATNGRAFNGAGTMEGAGVGTGVMVNDNGTAWKVAGTNVTVSA